MRWRELIPPVNLRQLILGLAVAAVLLTLMNVLYASYRVQREAILENTLESNEAYARKLAEVTDVFLDDARQEIAYHAARMGGQWDDARVRTDILERLHGQSKAFSSVVAVDADGRLLAISPSGRYPVNEILRTEGAMRSLRERRALISAPYVSASGHMMVLLSHPVFSRDGRYLGYLAGTIYLQADNVLHAMLGLHYYDDGSYVYVVDPSRRLIYHPDSKRLGQMVAGNPIIDRVLSGRSGQLRAVNSTGTDMLAGYASMRNGGWGVIVQRPVEATLGALNRQMLRTQLYTLPLFAAALLLIWWLSRLIALPLWQLANRARVMDRSSSLEDIRRVRSWYFEAAQIKRSILIGLGLLNHRIRQLDEASSTDPLTGLYNRRGMQAWREQAAREGRSYAVLQLDIDHFKHVNDTWGHDAGDKVLRLLADIIRAGLRPGDLPCRTGGEEFTVLLPGIGPDAAWAVAERLRQQVAQATWPIPAPLTISIGLAHLPASGDDGDRVLKQADEALYEAKRSGRNRVVRAPGA